MPGSFDPKQFMADRLFKAGQLLAQLFSPEFKSSFPEGWSAETGEGLTQLLDEASKSAGETDPDHLLGIIDRIQEEEKVSERRQKLFLVKPRGARSR